MLRTVGVRLTPKAIEDIDNRARNLGVSRSEFLRDRIAVALATDELGTKEEVDST